MNYHRMYSVTGLMRALESGFALGLDCQASPVNLTGFWDWIRLSPDSDTWSIEWGGWGTREGLAPLVGDLISYPWKWHIGLVEDNPDGSRGDFEVMHEDTLPWILGE